MILSPLHYPGGKSFVVKDLIQFLPPNTTEIVSPFLGGGSFEIYLSRLGINVYAYDAYQPLINFWYYLTKHTDKLVDIIETYIPITSERYYELRNNFKTLNQYDIETAAIFFVVNRMSYSGTTLEGGYSSQQRFDKIVTKRLRKFIYGNLKVKHQDFQKTISNNPNKVLYCDPPYMIDSTLYTHTGKGIDFNHNKLHTILHKYKGNWVLSYNDCKEIRNLYSDYHITNIKNLRKYELVITNF